MKIDKNSVTWKSAPWYIKVGALGIHSYNGIKKISMFCAVFGIIAPFFSFWLYINVSYHSAYVAMAFSTMGWSAYMYSLTLIWLLKNPQAMYDV